MPSGKKMAYHPHRMPKERAVGEIVCKPPGKKRRLLSRLALGMKTPNTPLMIQLKDNAATYRIPTEYLKPMCKRLVRTEIVSRLSIELALAEYFEVARRLPRKKAWQKARATLKKWRL